MKKRRGMLTCILALSMMMTSLAGCGKAKDVVDEMLTNGDMNQVSMDMAESATENVGYDCVVMEEMNTEEYDAITENGFYSVKVQPLSTFSADVDTASYSNIRRMLQDGYLPEEIPEGAVRIEEMLNYFSYNYETPKEDEKFGITINATRCPWNKENGLLRVGIQTEEIDFSASPESNLVFLLDVSGSMNAPDKLPLLKQAFSMLVDNLGEKDRISIVTYAGDEAVVLDGGRGNEKGDILEALYCLEAGGSTNGSAGIETAYAIAEKHFIEGGNNRVILATDGDLNVGVTSESQLKKLIEEKKKSGVYLSVLGFGTGNIKDNKMETLADCGNGNYAYIDSLMEAKRVMVDELGSTLLTVAEDVKFQIEFNPAMIAEYRLIGYENRLLNAEDFTDDTKDAGEIGAGHSVTALYEVVWTTDATANGIDLKYQTAEVNTAYKDEWATLKIRYKEPGKSKSKEIAKSFGEEIYHENVKEAHMLLEASVAEFGMLLRNSEWKGDSSYDHILSMWEGILYGGNEEVAEFIELVKMARDQKEICSYPLEGTIIQDRPPAVGLETKKGEMVACTFATMGTYSWSYEDENGNIQGRCVDSSAPTEWAEIATIRMEDTEGKIKLLFSDDVLKYSICYWIENATCGVADPVAMEGDTIILEDEMAKGIYEIHVEYPNGDVYYGFKVE